jgi:hypothetical protein
MDGAIDIRLIVTLLGVAASIFGGAAVAKMRIKDLQQAISEIHATIKVNDRRIDSLESAENVIKQRLDIIAKMNAPDVLERRNREVASMLSDIAYLRAEAAKMHHLHNGSHPPVASERKAT